MSHELPVSHCKLCKEEAPDCECSRGKRAEWMMEGCDPWEQLKCDFAQKKLLSWLEINWKEGMAFYDMLKQFEEANNGK